MLQTLYILNFVLIEELQLDFKDGFSAFIGETGAGKSILMDAISLVCGERGSSDIVRHGTSKAVIEASFDSNEAVNCILEEAGIDADDIITLTREISSEGKSICRVNHRVVNLSMLKEIGSRLITMHSQFDTVAMKINGSYLNMLDRYINRNDIMANYQNTYKEYLQVLNEKKEFLENTLSSDELELIGYNVDEITNADIGEHELDELEEKMKLLQSSEMIERIGNESIELIDGENGVTEKLYEAIHMMRNAKDISTFTELADKLDEHYYEIKDEVEELVSVISSVSEESENFEALQERAFEIRRLYRKYGGSYTSMMNRFDEYSKQLEQYGNSQEYEETLRKREEQLYNALIEQAAFIHDIRMENATRLESAILKELKDLQLKNADFKIRITTKEHPEKDGMDDVVFEVSMNKGEALRPLMKCASGGELSRFMLGLKVVFKDVDDVNTIIFDEIDSGISGSTAYAIGRKMRELAANCQVFSVTHLAQVAAACDNLYFINKTTKNDATYTDIQLLDEETRYEKLALIATGTVSNTTITTAKEMVMTARSE